MTREKRTSGVECPDCGEFSMEKSYEGSSLAVDSSGYRDLTLPDSCPVCGSELQQFEHGAEL